MDASTTPNAVSVLLVVDMINDTAVTVEREREQIGEFLNQDGGRLAHPVSIAALTEGGVKMMQGYSLDGHEVLTAFQTMKSELRPVGRDAGFYGAAEHLQESFERADADFGLPFHSGRAQACGRYWGPAGPCCPAPAWKSRQSSARGSLTRWCD